MGFTIAFVSSAVVVPTMIHLKEQDCGVDKDILVISPYIAGQFYEASRKTHLLQQRDKGGPLGALPLVELIEQKLEVKIFS